MFPINTLEESMPGLWGAQQVNKLYQQGLQSQYMPRTLQEQLRYAQLVNQYYGPQAEAEIGLKGAHGNYYNQMANWFGPTAQSEIALRGIQGQNLTSEIAQRAYQQNNPLAQLSTMPPLFKAQALYKHYADTLGADNPITQDAKKNYELMQKSAQGMSEWRNAMTETSGMRFLTPEAKSLLEAQQAAAGINPSARTAPAGLPMQPQANQILQETAPIQNIGNATNITPERAQNTLNILKQMEAEGGRVTSEQKRQAESILANAIAQQGSQKPTYQPSPVSLNEAQTPAKYAPVMTPQQTAGLLTSAAIKRSGTSNQVNRSIAGAFADTTLDNMLKDESAMEYFTGGEGRTKLALERAAAAAGNSSPEYQAYERYKTNGALLATQLRMFYGDSVQEEAAKKLDALTNPSSWDKDPKAAQEKLNAFVKTFRQERKIVQESLFNPMAVHQEKEPPIKTLSEVNKVAKSEGERVLNGKRYVKQNGKWHEA